MRNPGLEVVSIYSILYISILYVCVYIHICLYSLGAKKGPNICALRCPPGTPWHHDVIVSPLSLALGFRTVAPFLQRPGLTHRQLLSTQPSQERRDAEENEASCGHVKRRVDIWVCIQTGRSPQHTLGVPIKYTTKLGLQRSTSRLSSCTSGHGKIMKKDGKRPMTPPKLVLHLSTSRTSHAANARTPSQSLEWPVSEWTPASCSRSKHGVSCQFQTHAVNQTLRQKGSMFAVL